jgi:ribosomal-protein-serine acetyltransferase
MTHKMMLETPARIETERLILRGYAAGDGPVLYLASQRNRTHLQRYESGNVLMEIASREEAEIAAREMHAGWTNRSYFFLGAFEKGTGEFAAQVYIGPVNWELGEFEVGYIADVEHEGKGFVTEAVKAALRFIFTRLEAHRVTIRCSESNLRSQRVAERCGFVKEGLIRENEKNPDGTFGGSVLFGLLKREWAEVNG